MPSYDGREHSRSVGRSLLWVPRIALFPLYLVSEGVRRPLGALFSYAEEHHWQERWRDFFTFGDKHQIGLFPTGRIDLGLRPTVGFYFFWNDTIAHSDLRLRVTLSGLDAFNVHTLMRTPLGKTRKLTLTFHFAQRADRDFYGFGPTAPDDAARFYEQRLEGKASLWQELSEISAITTYMGIRSEQFDPDATSRRSLEEQIELGVLRPPPGLESGVLALYSGVSARVDTRAPRLTRNPTTASAYDHRGGSGVVVAGRIEHWSGLEKSRATAADAGRLPEWVKYGASAGASVDLTGSRRTIDLITTLELADPLPGDNPIPFTELVSLGGNQPLRAFRTGRLLDRSATSATLTYRWPIWVFLDGNVHYAVGNVFGPHLDGFRPGLLRSSFGIGIDSAGSSDHPFEVLLAFGTAPFDEGARIENLRFVFGTRSEL
jgi:hypothetical protein